MGWQERYIIQVSDRLITQIQQMRSGCYRELRFEVLSMISMFCFHVSLQNLKLSAEADTCWKLPQFTFLMKLAKALDLINSTLQYVDIYGDVIVFRNNWLPNSWKNMNYFSDQRLITFSGSNFIWAVLPYSSITQSVPFLMNWNCP